MLEMIDVKFQHNFRYPPGNESIFPPKGVSLKIIIDSKMPARLGERIWDSFPGG